MFSIGSQVESLKNTVRQLEAENQVLTLTSQVEKESLQQQVRAVELEYQKGQRWVG